MENEKGVFVTDTGEINEAFRTFDQKNIGGDITIEEVQLAIKETKSWKVLRG